MARTQSFVVDPAHKNLSPYHFLCRVLEGATPAQVRELMRRGDVTIDGGTERLHLPLRKGNLVEVRFALAGPKARGAPRAGKRSALRVLFQSDDVIAVDKPAGVAVVPERRREKGTVLDLLPAPLRRDASGQVTRVVHRLDKHTSGALLLARDREAKRRLCGAFQDRTIHKEYLALVRGDVPGESGTVDAPIGKDRRHALRMVIDEKRGKDSLTHWRIERRFRGYTLLRLEPVTGRTHQIRVHLAHLGFPVLCDELYGARKELYLSELKPGFRAKEGRTEKPLLDRLFLHCEALEFPVGAAGERARVTSPLPKDLNVVLRQLERWRPASPSRGAGAGSPRSDLEPDPADR